MQLIEVEVERFQNFLDRQVITIEPDVTCFVGKNESGKTTVLKALHRLKPANGTGRKFDLTTEYPRARLARDRRNEDLAALYPVAATFLLDAGDLEAIGEAATTSIPEGIRLRIARSYSNGLLIELLADFSTLLQAAADSASVHADDLAKLAESTDSDDVSAACTTLARTLKEEGEAARSKAVAALGRELRKLLEHTGRISDETVRTAIWTRVPKFYYFSDYENLPGVSDLTALAKKIADDEEALTSREETVVSLLDYAGVEPKDFLAEDYNSRRAELQTASADLSLKVFDYWKQNPDLTVVFDTDMAVVGHSADPYKHEIRHRKLHVLLRDDRHGGVETNFETRSAGFQWFFSFLAGFSRYQGERVIVLLDEPATKLHGDAQRDFLRYIYNDLGSETQVLYTTHSQHMIDPGKYEKLRAVHDRATRENINAGVAVTTVDLSADRDTILPVEASLGYSVSQHLFLGSGHHLLVEGSADFVYLQRVSDYLLEQGKLGLNGRFAVIPVGGIDNFAPFVALMGRRFPITALLDGAQSSRQYHRVRHAAETVNVDPGSILVCGEVSDDLPKTADIEDMFDTEDYLWLYRRAVKSLSIEELPNTDEPILKRISKVQGTFDHALPAHALTRASAEFFEQARPLTIQRFQALFEALDQTLPRESDG